MKRLKRKKLERKLFSFLLTLAMIVGLMPGMGLTAYAADVPYASLKNTTSVINFDGKEWYLIDYDTSTVTLLSKECVGASKFNNFIYDIPAYSGSIVETAVNNYYTSSISSDVKSAIVDNKMFLLTTDQAKTIKEANLEVLKCNQASGANENAWWLGSPGDVGFSAAIVYGDSGDINDYGCDVEDNYGVRPALKLDLSKVTFDSATNTFSASKLTLNVGENGKVVMSSGIYGNGEEDLLELTSDVDNKGTMIVADGYCIKVNEGANLNILNPGKISFYPAANNTGTITAVPADGYVFAGWYNGETLYSESEALDYKNISEDLTLTAKFGVIGYSVTITAGDNMTKTSGEDTQTGVSGAMTDVVYTADAGYYFPTDYSVATVNGISVTRNSYTQVTVSGTPTADATITLTAPTAKVASVVTKAPEAKTLTYNGQEQELVTAGTATGGQMQYALGNATEATGPYTTDIPAKTDAGPYYVWYKVKADETHNDTDANYVEVSIGKRSVTLTSATASKTYDGNALKNSDVTVSGDGFATGEGATYRVTGSQKVVGSSANAFTYTLNNGTKEANYNITKTEGTLTVTNRDTKYQISPQANSDEVKYDGQSHEVTGFETDTFTVEGNTYTISGLTAAGSGTDAGSHTVSVSGTAVVKDSDGTDVSDQFAVTPQTGTLTINKRRVTMTSATASKTYDGNALTDNTVTTSGDGFATGEGSTYNVTGSQKVVGSSANAFTYTLNTGTKEANYNITKTEGTLTVTSRDVKYQISPQANSDEVKYDGQSHEVTGFETDTFTVEGNTYTVSGLTAAGAGTDAGSYTVSVSGTAVVKDSDGNDVSDEFAVTPQTGTLTINKRSVTLTSASDDKEYDGDALTNTEVTVTGDGFITGEGADYDVTGTRTLVGESENTFTYTLKENTKAGNYDITTSYGTLTINNRNTKYEVILKANSGTEKYDGKEKTVSGYTIDGNAGEGTGESAVTSFTASNGKIYTVTGMSAEVTGTNAGEYVVNVIGTPIVKDADGNDVTAQFAVSSESGKLTIDKRSVTLTSATDTKVYDGKALSNDEITVSEDGFAEGEGAIYDVTGSQTLAGESANAFTYALNDGTIADNYDITTVEGKLTVTKSDSSGEVTAVSGLVYDGKAKALVTAGKTEGGTLMYRLGNDGKWQQDIPEATDAGTYKIYYYIKGDDNHKDDGSEKEPKGSVETTIKKAAQDKPTETFATTKASDDKTADGKISGLDKAKTYQYSADDGRTWTDVKAGSTEIAVKSGTYQIRYAEDKNHEAGKAVSVTVTAKLAKTKATINLKSVTQKNNKVQVSWTKVDEADGYDVYIHYCGSKAKKVVKTIKGNSTTSASFKKIDGKKINQKKNFHVKVVAYKMVDGKKVTLAKTITGHLAGAKSVKYINPKALKLTKSTYSIKVGKTAKIKAKVTLENSKKKFLPKSHGAKLRYKSSNTKIAIVNKNGKITGKSKGTCYIYIYTINGLMKKVKVTVK